MKMQKKQNRIWKKPKIVFTTPFYTYPYIHIKLYVSSLILSQHTWLFLSCNSWKEMLLFAKMGVSQLGEPLWSPINIKSIAENWSQSQG